MIARRLNPAPLVMPTCFRARDIKVSGRGVTRITLNYARRKSVSRSLSTHIGIAKELIMLIEALVVTSVLLGTYVFIVWASEEDWNKK
jgi:hypothetical protein